MKKMTLIAIAVVMGMVARANALNYAPNYLPPVIVQASNPTDADVLAAWQTALGDPTATIGSMLYKWTPSSNTEDGDTGLFASSMTIGAQNLQTVDLNYTGGSPEPGLTAIVVKNGRSGWMLYDARTWTSVYSDLIVNNDYLWNNANDRASISHVAVYGTIGNRVPEGGSALILLSCSLLGLEAFRRRLV